MKLLTKAIQAKAEKQYPLGADMNQMVVAKFFNPAGSWSWYLMNKSPEDDYCWGIVKGNEVEMGSFSLSELEAHKRPLPLERDMWFKPMNAKELWDRLLKGEHI
jgi:hypothetical protein